MESSDTGTSCFILPQLRQEDPEPWLNYMRMSPEMFTCYLVLYHISSFIIVIYGTTLSRVAPVVFPCLPYCSRFHPIFPCFSSTGQYNGGGGCIHPLFLFLPISPRFSPLRPVPFPFSTGSFRVLPYRQKIRETAQYGVCVMGVLILKGNAWHFLRQFWKIHP
jgi:hypothetical protein